MKKIFGILSALLIVVCFTNEAKAYQINDGGGEIVKSEVSYEIAPMVVALNPTMVDNVVVSSVENVVASVTSNKEVGGSIVSSDANYPDQDNIVMGDSGNLYKSIFDKRLNDKYAITKSKRTMLLHLLSLRQPKKYLASNDNFNSVTNDKVGNIPTNVGKLA